MCHSNPNSNLPALTTADPWVSRDGTVAHPDAPRGGGGSGRFHRPGNARVSPTDDGLPNPFAPVPQTLDPLDIQQFGQQLQAKAAAKKNPAPRVTRDSTQTIHGMTVTVKADATGATGITGAQTDCNDQSSGSISYAFDSHHKITSFTNTIHMSATIQTRYGTGSPDDISAYGRGTTVADQQAGDITLGFHESRHRADYLNFLRNTPIPQFSGTNGMTEQDFTQATDDYKRAWEKYFKDLSDKSVSDTDEVGNPTRSAWCQSNPGSCP